VLAALPLATVAAAVLASYGLGYGVIESAGVSWPPAPGRRWQVPQDLLIGASPGRRMLIWGALLGPGFATRNPYAGFAALPVAVAAAARIAGGSLGAAVALAALTGAAHAAGRALALVRDTARPDGDPMTMLLRSVRWRVADGYVLLSLAGAALILLAAGLS
jgi:hypothetical protein